LKSARDVSASGAIALAFAAIALVAFHLFPLPPSVWTYLPGRDLVGAAFDAAGQSRPWLPLSLRSDEAWRVLTALAPPAAILFATLQLGAAQRLLLLLLIVAVACLNVIVGMLQVINGGQDFLYFYEFTNVGRAVGLFANANHVTALLYAAIPLAAAILADARLKEPVPSWALLAAVVFLLILGLSLTGSRTALILGAAALFSFVVATPRGYFDGLTSRRNRWIWGVVAAVATLPIALGIGLSAILSRFESQDILEDARFSLLPGAWRALGASFPAGSGAGAFETWFQMHEARSDIGHAIVNHVHNDWLEFVIEFGLPGALLVVCALVWLTISSFRAFRSGDDLGARIAKSACIVLWLLLIHSLWDYPLRTLSLASVAAVCCGVLAPARAGEASFGFASLFSSEGRKHRRRKRAPAGVSA
jgi:O-antigen ligase